MWERASQGSDSLGVSLCVCPWLAFQRGAVQRCWLDATRDPTTASSCTACLLATHPPAYDHPAFLLCVVLSVAFSTRFLRPNLVRGQAVGRDPGAGWRRGGRDTGAAANPMHPSGYVNCDGKDDNDSGGDRRCRSNLSVCSV